MEGQKSKRLSRPVNLRDFPEDLYWATKEYAAKKRMTLKAFVVAAVEDAIAREKSKALTRDR